MGTQNTLIADVSYIKCETRIIVQLVPQKWEIFVKIENKDDEKLLDNF